ncbi:MAG TPA: M48 family metalloprotease [Steroidobacteraceae bacterium]|nr:M48 family metalloprotease [Steroidobacteraceae bacterium]
MSAASPPHLPADSPTLAPWTSAERESFFDAIARHRRAAWRVTFAGGVADAVAALVVAVLMAPLFYAGLALLLDLVNLAVPAPNLVDTIDRWITPAIDTPQTLSLRDWLRLGLVAALPGLLWMLLVLLVLKRAVRLCGMFASGDVAARAPNVQVLAEQRFANVVAEMAIAANVPPPRLLVADSGASNAAVFGSDEQHATIIASEALLAALNREQMQGIAAHLVGSIADGDMTIGMRVATTVGLFGLIAKFAGTFDNGPAVRRLVSAFAATAFRPTPEAARRFVAELADPFAPDTPRREARGRDAQQATRREERNWRRLLWIPLAGPLVITGFFGGLVSLFLLQPLVSLAWRQRKYMADAIAVRLTRDPDALAGALGRMSGTVAGGMFASWAAHLSVVRPDGARASANLLATSFVPPFPSMRRRLQALAKLGAQVTVLPHGWPRQLLIILVPLAALIGVLVCVALYLMTFLSVALSMLFLGLPFAIVHVLLRLVGH